MVTLKVFTTVYYSFGNAVMTSLHIETSFIFFQQITHRNPVSF